MLIRVIFDFKKSLYQQMSQKMPIHPKTYSSCKRKFGFIAQNILILQLFRNEWYPNVYNMTQRYTRAINHYSN